MQLCMTRAFSLKHGWFGSSSQNISSRVSSKVACIVISDFQLMENPFKCANRAGKWWMNGIVCAFKCPSFEYNVAITSV